MNGVPPSGHCRLGAKQMEQYQWVATWAHLLRIKHGMKLTTNALKLARHSGHCSYRHRNHRPGITLHDRMTSAWFPWYTTDSATLLGMITYWIPFEFPAAFIGVRHSVKNRKVRTQESMPSSLSSWPVAWRFTRALRLLSRVFYEKGCHTKLSNFFTAVQLLTGMASECNQGMLSICSPLFTFHLKLLSIGHQTFRKSRVWLVKLNGILSVSLFVQNGFRST